MHVPTHLSVDGLSSPVTVGPAPRLGWRTPGTQTGYELELVDAHGGTRWSSGLVESGESVLVPYTGPVLAPGNRFRWRVSVTTAQERSAWSEWASFGTLPGFTAVPVWAPSGDWAFVRTEVDLPADAAWAHLYATGSSGEPTRQFVAKVWVNDEVVGITPTRAVAGETRVDGWDVTRFLAAGRLAVGLLAYTPSDHRLLAEVVLGCTDGRVIHVGTDATWRALDGGGAYPPSGSIGTSYFTAPQEDLDQSAYPTDLASPGFDDSAWPDAVPAEPFAELVATPTARVERRLVPPVTVESLPSGRYLVDYGRTWVGGLRLAVAHPTEVEIRYGLVRDGADDVLWRTSAGNAYRDRWSLVGGAPAETWGMRVFRHVAIDGLPDGMGAADLCASAYVYPDDDEAAFRSGDAALDQIWALCRHTLLATNGNLYVDSWEREREPYEADTYLQLLAGATVSADSTLARYSLDYLLRRRTWPTEWPLYLPLAVRVAVEASGDLQWADEVYERVRGLLPEQWLDHATGLVRKDFGNDGSHSAVDHDIVDWPMSERDGFVFSPYNTVVNALAAKAYEDVAVLAGWLGRDADAAWCAGRARGLGAAMRRLLWDESAGAFRDGLRAGGRPIDHHAAHATLFPLGCGVAGQHSARATETLGKRGMACSVYAAAFLLQGLFDADRPDLALGLLTGGGLRSYRSMLDAGSGSGSTMEAWHVSLKPNTTYSHPWAAHPVAVLARGLFGIRPTSPGYSTFDVRLRLGPLEWAEITVPTVRGPIHVAYDPEHLIFDVPGNSVCQVAGATYGPGRHSLRRRP